LGSPRIAHLLDTGPIVSRKAARHSIRGAADVSELGAIQLLGLGAHAGYREDLLVFLDALLELAKQDPEAW
jgi:hypothetical protein